VTVTTPEGTSAAGSADRFTYVVTVTKIEPNNGPLAGGTSVTITGTNFTGATAVKFGATNATSFTVNSATSITAVSPAGTGTVDVTVTTSEGTSAAGSADRFTYVTEPPTVSKVVPRSGPNAGGTPVEVVGTHFVEVTAVKFGSANAASFTVNSETSITAVAPPFTFGSARVPVTVTTPAGVSPIRENATILSEQYFGYAPTVTRVSPNSGPTAGGTLVMITGTAFESIRKSDEFPPFVGSVKFGSTNATSFTVNSEGSIINAVAPAGTGTVDVTVETGAGTSLTSSADHFTFTPTAPTVATTAASSVTRTLATLNGTVNPNSGNVTECKFEYGPTTSYGSTAPCASPPGSGSSAVAVTASLGNLSRATTYHFRVSATNAGGTSTGSDQTFTTLTALPTPHWYKNAMKVPLGEKSPLIGWGTLTLESSAGTATCHSAQAANVENTAGAATKEVLLFATWECKSVAGSCTAGEQRATPGHLPWQGTMLEEGAEGSGEFREEGWGIELNLECFKGGVDTSNQLFKTGPVLAETGTSTPKWLNGTSATKPSEASFDTESGHLEAEVEKAAVKGTTKGKLKFVGYQDNATVPLIALAKP
jgi:hypothetical protein